MADPFTIANPYSVDPATYVQSALTPMTGHTMMPTMTPAAYNAQSFYGPTHAALSQAFQAALQQQLGVPGLLSQMQADPALAQKIGGLLSSYYTPPAPSHYSIDWAKAAEDAKKTTPVTSATGSDGSSEGSSPGNPESGGGGW